MDRGIAPGVRYSKVVSLVDGEFESCATASAGRAGPSTWPRPPARQCPPIGPTNCPSEPSTHPGFRERTMSISTSFVTAHPSISANGSAASPPGTIAPARRHGPATRTRWPVAGGCLRARRRGRGPYASRHRVLYAAATCGGAHDDEDAIESALSIMAVAVAERGMTEAEREAGCGRASWPGFVRAPGPRTISIGWRSRPPP